MKKASENNYNATGFELSYSKRKKHIYTKVYLYNYIIFMIWQGEGSEETLVTEPLDLKGQKNEIQ